MLFNSLEYLLFFTCLFFAYYVLPRRFQWMLLLAFSLVFYLCSDIKFVVFLMLSICITYGCSVYIGVINNKFDAAIHLQGKDITRSEKKKIRTNFDHQKRIVLVLALVANIGILAFLKYFNFISKNINGALSLFGVPANIPALNLFLPLGISFYTFTSTGYLIDVYRGEMPPQKNLAKYALFVSFFPHILQGPISKYSDLAPQLYAYHDFNYDQVANGLRLMIWGYFKKVVIADRAALFVNQIFGDYSQYAGFQILIAAVLYAVQIYADFSGYMDIAKGSAECLGIRLADNFIRPYFSKSIAEYWRRWHITLGEWLRNYVFYSILRSGWCNHIAKASKKHLPKSLTQKVPSVIGLAISWLIIGAWHGASWHYIFHGIYHGSLIILAMLFAPFFKWLVEKLRINTECFSYRLFQVIRTFSLVCLGYIIFRAPGLKLAFQMIKHMFIHFMPAVIIDDVLIQQGFDYRYFFPLIFFSMILLVVSLMQRRMNLRQALAKQNVLFRWMVYFCAAFFILFYGVWNFGSSANQFIYFQF